MSLVKDGSWEPTTPYGYDAHVEYCEQCMAYESLGSIEVPEGLCSVGRKLKHDN